MKRYTDTYTNDDLFDMFANQAHQTKLAFQNTEEVEAQLKELAPDMEDTLDVARTIQRMAATRART